MKTHIQLLLVLLCTTLTLSTYAQGAESLSGAWHFNDYGTEHLIIFQDGYVTHTVYEQEKFLMSHGGPFTINDKNIDILVEYNSDDSNEVGTHLDLGFELRSENLLLNYFGEDIPFDRIDDGKAPLAGVWQITDRMEGGQLKPIQRSGTRKTLKILTGTRFQWFAIDPATKLFAGTGGGTYTYTDGKYTENIEFFSRDNGRVGAQLTFDGKLENGKWHHSGLSSKGDEIYEVWSRAPIL